MEQKVGGKKKRYITVKNVQLFLMAAATLKEALLWIHGMQPSQWCAPSWVIYTVNDTLRKSVTLSVSKRAGKRRSEGKKTVVWQVRAKVAAPAAAPLIRRQTTFHLRVLLSRLLISHVRSSICPASTPVGPEVLGSDLMLTPTCCCPRRWRMSSSRRVSAVRSEATEISTTLKSTWAILCSPNSGIWWVISPATACSLPDLSDRPAYFHLN